MYILVICHFSLLFLSIFFVESRQHNLVTVAILAQGTSWAVAVTQAFLFIVPPCFISLAPAYFSKIPGPIPTRQGALRVPTHQFLHISSACELVGTRPQRMTLGCEVFVQVQMAQLSQEVFANLTLHVFGFCTSSLFAKEK